MARRLSAMLAADVGGYSRLMGANETGTLAALKTLRTDFIDGKIAEHQGRIVKLTGDGMLVEFPSVVNAIACAPSCSAVSVNETPVCRKITASNSAWALTWAMSLCKGMIFLAMVSTSRRAWRALPRPVG